MKKCLLFLENVPIMFRRLVPIHRQSFVDLSVTAENPLARHPGEGRGPVPQAVNLTSWIPGQARNDENGLLTIIDCPVRGHLFRGNSRTRRRN